MEITRMNQTCPHCQALVILPELVRNYGDMPIQCHDCENSFFLPTDQLSKTSGGVVRHRCGSCKSALYLPKMKQISAPLRFVCPNCISPLPAPALTAFTRLARHSSGRLPRAFYRRGRVSIGTRLFGDAESGLGDDTDKIN